MGGVAPADCQTKINVGKNNKVQAVALDFNLITRSIEERKRQAMEDKENASGTGGKKSHTHSASAGVVSVSASASSAVQPDTSMVQKMANLLNVQLGGGESSSNKSTKQAKEDGLLSAILGSANTTSEPKKQNDNTKKGSNKAPPHMDVRSKYAKKLRNRIEGGVAGLELAQSEKDDTMKHGDASLHLAARNLISDGLGAELNPSSSKWLATTGVGKLLSYLSGPQGRSMKIVLLPLPSTSVRPQTDANVKQTSEEMERLTRQLSHINFDLLVSDGRNRKGVQLDNIDKCNQDAAQDVMKYVTTEIDDIEPIKFVVVSDRDDYLKAARDSGMFTIRVRPLNKRRGNVTTNYNVEDVGSVQDVINEINGISFNSVFTG